MASILLRSTTLRPGLALRLAARGLRRSPGMSLVAAAVLTLGLAAPTVFFSILVGAIRPLPVPRGDRIVRADVVQPREGGRAVPVRLSDLRRLQGSESLQALGGFTTFDATLVDRGHAAVRVGAAGLTPGVFPLLRARPVLGRLPGAGDAGDAVVIGYDVWQQAYDGSRAVLGRTVLMNGTPHTVVGVMPRGFGFPMKEDAWTILDEAGDADATVELVGRLADGATPAAATAELGARWRVGDVDRSAAERGGVMRVQDYTRGWGGRGEKVLFVGLVLVALCLLVIACANVANLLLVRATERVRSLGVQAALGAGRGQLGAQLFLEALLVALGGGVLGLSLAWWLVGLIQRTLGPENFGYFWMHMAVDGRVVAFTAALVLGTAVLAGLLPVVRILRVDVLQILKEEGAATGMGGGGAWSRAFVTGQLALSCAALVAAGLAAQPLLASRDFGHGVPAKHVLVASVDIQEPGRAPAPGLASRLETAVQGLSGASAAALALGAPGYHEGHSAMELQGAVYPRPQDRPGTSWDAVSPGFFRVLGLHILSGRGLASSDLRGSPRVAVVSESWVHRYSPNAPPLGRRLRLMRADSTAWATVVGVVADANLGGGTPAGEDRVYVPLTQVNARTLMLLVRSRGEPAALAGALRAAVAHVDPGLALWDVRSLADAYAYMIRVPRAMGTEALAGGLAGLLVAGVGLYGLLAFGVRRRRRELGVRMALGADGARVMRSVLGVALRQLLPAVAVGLALAWIATSFLQEMLPGGDLHSPSAYAAAALTFLAVGLLAAAVPAVRASRVDPARTLRGE
jgi:putative ABC transport system permease protein